MKLILTILVLVVSFVQESNGNYAEALMYLTGTNDFIGTISFNEQEVAWGVIISDSVNRVRPSATLGFHIHSLPIGDNHNCSAGGAHFNPYNVSHGMPRDALRHVGDLGNIETDADGRAYIAMRDNVISIGFDKTRNVVGLPIVIHNLTDHGGHTGKGESNTTGNAGARVACGTILSS
ncbi:unnamed protein product [Rotaria socialis]|uniref:Superoxide dismutase [Cu-Zn] n=1 Tax=Rotaria socialis TaxID=392032 RepID=A0A817YFV4_9BILA|nr:unnamed protein product [Rotaria socialis]CAF4631246.1 unnamed protein product [Rotaria socialis]